MTVLDTEMHAVTFVITVFELTMLFFAVIWFLSRPGDSNRRRYILLLTLLILYNIFSGLFPDENLRIPLAIQLVLAYLGGFTVSMYFVYYIYKTFELETLKSISIYGAIGFLFLPFILLFVLPYMITGNAELSRQLVVIFPFIFSVAYVYALTKALWSCYRNISNPIEREEIIGVFISVLLWATLPIIVFFDGGQVIENGTTNTGFMIMSVLYIRSAIFRSREDYQNLLKSQEQLKRTNEILQEKVEERTRELKVANEKRLVSFINLMHETKTPLTLINNCLDQLIIKAGNSEEANMAKTSLKKLNQNMRNFFDLNKLERGLHIYDHTIVADISEIIQKVVPLFQTWAYSKHIEITADIEDGVLARADPEALNRIIDNLLENAIKYSYQGGQIFLSLQQDGGHINFIVKDEGPGISKEYQKKIFEPYFQIDHKKKNVQGMGMGLAMVKRTVKSLEGTIQVISDIGKGTEVVVKIPIYKHDIDQPVAIFSNGFNQMVRQNEYEVTDKVVGDTLQNILIIEDQQDFLYLLHKNLCKNYNVYVAENGLEALKKLEVMPIIPDLIVSDIMMDEMDGFAFVQRMRKQRRFQHIPIIFTTAISEVEKRLEGIKLGAVDFILKPFSIEELQEKIKSILSNIHLQKLALVNHASRLMNGSQISFHKNGISYEERCKELGLTARQSEIAKFLIEAKSYKEISERLYISEKTVSRHATDIFNKLKVKSRFELMNLFEQSRKQA